MLRRLLGLVMCAVALVAACSGDDEEVASDDPTTTEAAIAPDQVCEAIQVLLKLDLSDDERAAVEAEVDEVDGVTATQLQAAEAEGEPPVLLVTTESEEAAIEVGEALAGDPAVVSVVHPEQVC